MYVYCLPSLELFAPPNSEVVVVLDDENQADHILAKKLLVDWHDRLETRGVELMVFFEAKPDFYEQFPGAHNHGSKGHDRAQWSYFYATNYTRAPIIGLMDSDSVLRRPLLLSEWTNNGRLTVLLKSEASRFDAGNNFAFNLNPNETGSVNGMTDSFPVFLRADTFRRIRQRIEQTHARSFDLAMVDILQYPTAQFSIFLLGALLLEPSNYEFVDLDKKDVAVPGHHIPWWWHKSASLPMSFIWTEAWCHLSPTAMNGSDFCSVFRNKPFSNIFELVPNWFEYSRNVSTSLLSSKLREAIGGSVAEALPPMFQSSFDRTQFKCFPVTAINDVYFIVSTQWKSETGRVLSFAEYNPATCSILLVYNGVRRTCRIFFRISRTPHQPILSFESCTLPGGGDGEATAAAIVKPEYPVWASSIALYETPSGSEGQRSMMFNVSKLPFGDLHSNTFRSQIPISSLSA